jgi:hypothetical protein
VSDEIVIGTFEHEPVNMDGPCVRCGRPADHVIERENTKTGERQPDVMSCNDCIGIVAARVMRENTTADATQCAEVAAAATVWARTSKHKIDIGA